MNIEILQKHIKAYKKKIKEDPEKFDADREERSERIAYYRSMTREKILAMDEEAVYEYLSKLWAMRIWGNKKYAIDKIIRENTIEKLKQELADLLWSDKPSDKPIEQRWDRFKKEIKGMASAMVSELLGHVDPDNYITWNRRALIGLNYLEVKALPRYDYQLNGKKYAYLCTQFKTIAHEFNKAGLSDNSFLSIDYFIWDELQFDKNLSKIDLKQVAAGAKEKGAEKGEAMEEFIHNDVRDKLAEIGAMLGFKTSTEEKVADGSKVDAVWEAQIGNMGKVIYVFEVQTKGSIDSLIVNLLKSQNNPATQGVVAVSDAAQIEKIKRHAADVNDLRGRLKFWDYQEVLKVHESLSYVNESINNLGLVPDSF